MLAEADLLGDAVFGNGEVLGAKPVDRFAALVLDGDRLHYQANLHRDGFRGFIARGLVLTGQLRGDGGQFAPAQSQGQKPGGQGEGAGTPGEATRHGSRCSHIHQNLRRMVICMERIEPAFAGKPYCGVPTVFTQLVNATWFSTLVAST